jgi:large subunit ribosomal protein L35e
MAGSKIAAHTLRSQNKAELMKQLEDLKQELASLRVQKIAGGASSKVTKIHDVRKNIARVLTVITANQRQAVREQYKGKRTPLDLRVKQTRAIRRQLTKHEATKITEKQKKKLMHFPQRKYALKASA